MVDQAKDFAFVLAIVKALYREAYLTHLPPFTTAMKVSLHQSLIDSGLVFEHAKVKETLDKAEKTTSLTFRQVAAKTGQTASLPGYTSD